MFHSIIYSWLLCCTNMLHCAFVFIMFNCKYNSEFNWCDRITSSELYLDPLAFCSYFGSCFYLNVFISVYFVPFVYFILCQGCNMFIF